MNQDELIKSLEDKHKQVFGIAVEVMSGGRVPNKAHSSDAGFDVFASEDFSIKPGGVVRHPMAIKFQIPHGAWLRIEGKSGLGSKGLLVHAGVVDRGYRGITSVVMSHINTLDGEELFFKQGDKIAQITVNPHNEEYFMYQVDKVSNDTDRGSGGFGSTGSR